MAASKVVIVAGRRLKRISIVKNLDHRPVFLEKANTCEYAIFSQCLERNIRHQGIPTVKIPPGKNEKAERD